MAFKVWATKEDLLSVDLNANFALAASLDTAQTISGVKTISGGLILQDNVNLTFGTGSDATVDYDGTNLVIDPAVVGSGVVSLQGGLTVGVNDTGYDVKLFGATTGKYMLWDESANTLAVVGTDITLNGTSVAGGVALTGSTNNQVTTVTGADAIQGEGNLTFDGTTLAVTGGATISTELLMAGMPAFAAFNTSTQTNVTGDGTTVTAQFNSEVFDRGGDFASNTFTAPVTGIYQFTVSLELIGLNADTYEDLDMLLVTSNRNWYLAREEGKTYNSSGIRVVNGSAFVDMDAADTAYVTIAVGGGTKSVDVRGNASPNTFFAGHLVG